jgi:mannose/fructose/N-acetylgalactosamine-specific phosphotransferase system component IIC
MSVAAFVALNVVTIGMAAVGITLALVLAKRHATGPARPGR